MLSASTHPMVSDPGQTPRPHPVDRLVGKSLSHYAVLSRIGGGSQGVVYLARDTRLNRRVALKFLLPQWCQDDAALERALSEAGVPSTLAPDGARRTEADARQVGEAAARHGVVLLELRAADGAGLEELFLTLTSQTQREGAPA